MSTKRLPPIQINPYRAPTGANEGCPWSLGLLNLTERERDQIMLLARTLRSDNEIMDARGAAQSAASSPRQTAEGGVTWDDDFWKLRRAAMERMSAGEYDATVQRMTSGEERQRILAELEREDAKAARALERELQLRDPLMNPLPPPPPPEPEPEPNRNRFSGLDIG